MAQPRKLFEDVGDETPQARKAPAPGMIERGGGGARRGIRIWLMLLFVLVAAMVIVGGLTRLTDSGLSITEWRPVTGAMPPMNAAAWEAEFTLYKASPEYQLQNRGMSLGEFKVIYWWEWGHRQLGRVIGLVWAIGFFGFLAARRIPAGWTGRLLGIGVLGGLQGAIGWWMVASGLTGEMVDVASYRLATHLGLAFLILGFIAWYILLIGRTEAQLIQARRGREAGLFRLAGWLLGIAFVQILLGALVAGIDAGRSFTDWPWMAGKVFPPDAFELEPLWRNFFEDPGLVQFLHRVTGYVLILFALYVWSRARQSGNQATRAMFSYAAVMLLVQMVLGVFTVLLAAPLDVAITHQIGAILCWVLILAARFRAGYPQSQSVRG